MEQWGESAYVICLDTVLGCIRTQYSHLFDANAVELLHRLKHVPAAQLETDPGTLLYPEKCLLSRIVLRKSTWLKASSMSSYIPLATSAPTTSVRHALQQLELKGLVYLIKDSSDFELCWDAVQSCFDMGEIKDLCLSLGSVAVTNKEATLRRLRTVLTTQKSIDGRLASSRLAKLVVQQLWRKHGANEILVRVSPAVLHTLRRFERLAHLASDMDALRAGIGVSINTPATTSPALLVAFRKLRFPAYMLSPLPDLFPHDSKDLFERWEQANEMQAILLYFTAAEMQKLLRDEAIAEQHWSFLRVCSSCSDQRRLTDEQLGDKDESTRVVLFLMLALLQSQADEPEVGSRPEFLSMVDAGYLLSSACHGHVAALEKEPFKNYELAVLVVRLLLALPFAPLRRGKWYRRLSINLEQHLKDPAAAQRVLQVAVRDTLVKLGDATDLSHRLGKLQKRQAAGQSGGWDDLFSLASIRREVSSYCNRLLSMSSGAGVLSGSDIAFNPSCTVCTYRNQAGYQYCAMCESPLCPLQVEVMEATSVAGGVIDLTAGDSDGGGPLLDSAPLIAVGEEDALSSADLSLIGLAGTNQESEVVVLEITARRFGDTSRRGKNKFCGANDELLYVEQLVLEVLRSNSTDTFDNEHAHTREFLHGDGWEGVHDEGALLRALFCLLMWEVLFMSVPNVFISAFQDAPLDLYFASFYTSRKEAIEVALAALEAASHAELIASLGSVYRANYKCRCKRMAWHIPLPVLQLVAISIGGRGLAGLCRGMLVNFRYFGNGAPDLLVIRARRLSEDGQSSTVVAASSLLGMDWQSYGRLSLDAAGSSEDLLAPAKRTKKAETRVESKEAEDQEDAEETVSIPSPAPFEYTEADLMLPVVEDSCAMVFECMVVEVKGPSDVLSPQQVTWLKLLTSHGVKAFVCRVRESKIADKQR